MINNFEKKYVYDIEVFPNFFSAIFLDIDTREKETFVIFQNRNDTGRLFNFLNRNIQIIGYNNIYYDGVVLYYILENMELPIEDLLTNIFRISSKLVSDNFRFDKEIRELQFPGKELPYYQLDLMKILAFDKLGISLKQTSINLKWHKVQDLPLEYDTIVKKEQINTILDYNFNDVLITFELYKKILPLINLRKDLGEIFKVDLNNASDSKMANVLLEEIYSKELNLDINTIKNLRTKRDQFMLSECISDKIKFKTNKLKKVKLEIENTLVRKDTNYRYKKQIEFAGCKYELGIGGLHSVDDARLFETNDNYLIQDCDVSSYYPNIILNEKIIPEHLNDGFLKVLDKITKERLEAKHTGDKVKADGLKITINSIFGKLGSNTFWLEDAKAMISVTLSGQLYLLDLIESLALEGIPTISANTDGIICKIPRNLEKKYYEVCKEWEKRTNFELEYTPYSLYIRSDVNNYICKKPDNETKEKGRYIKEINIKKGYKYPIVAVAMYEYFINKKPVLETYKESKDILDFCISQKAGTDFQMEFHKNDNIELLQKNNRFFISKNGGKLIKRRKSDGSTIGLFVDQLTTVINNYDKNIPIDTYNIDYDFYVEEAYKYISDIEANTDTEIDFSINDISQDEIKIEKPDPEIEKILNKLSKIKGLSTIVVQNLLIIHREFKGKTFLDLLTFAEDNSYISSKFEDLIKIRYFEEFGKNKKLHTFYKEFTSGKNRYSKTHTDKTKEKRISELQKIWNELPNKNYSIQQQIKNELEILNEIQTNFPVNKNYAVALCVDTKYSPKIEFQNLLTGERKTFKINNKIYNEFPINKGDILLFKKVIKKNSMMRNEESKWVKIEDKFDLWLEVYYIVKENDKLLK